MAGNPCYLLTITSDVKRNDIILGKPDGDRPSEPNTAKLKASSGHSVNLSSISKSAPTRMEESREENDKGENNSYNDSSFNIPVKEPDSAGGPKKKQVIFLTARVHPGESNA